jgi:hypothetical protein
LLAVLALLFGYRGFQSKPVHHLSWRLRSKLSARRRENRRRLFYSALLGMMLLSSVSIPHVNALCPGSTKEAFPANGDDLRSEATSYIADPAAWRTTTASGATLTNEVRFGTNIVSFAPDAHTHLVSQTSEPSTHH